MALRAFNYTIFPHILAYSISRGACVLGTVVSRSDMIASLHRNCCLTARERSSHRAAKQTLSSIIFWFIGELFYSVNALIYLFYYVKTAISLLFYRFLPYNTYFYYILDIGDRRELVQPCAVLILCVIIPGWGGV